MYTKTTQSVSRSESFCTFSENTAEIQRLKNSLDPEVFVHFLQLLYSRVKKPKKTFFQKKEIAIYFYK